MSTISVCVTVPLDADAAFELFTREVDSWWKRGPAYRFRDGRDSTMAFEGDLGGRLVEYFGDGGKCREIGRITAWEPGRRLAFEWQEPRFREPVVTDIEVLFAAVEGGTRVTLTHSGTERLVAEHPARHGLAEVPFLRMRGDWWKAHLESLSRLAGRRLNP